MKIENAKAQLIDQKIRKFKEFMDEFQSLFSQGYMSFNMWESQHENLRLVNEEWKKKIAEAEEQFNKTLMANDLIEKEGKGLKEKAHADAMVIYSKAQTKYKEFEKLMEDYDRKRAKELLKGMEVLA